MTKSKKRQLTAQELEILYELLMQTATDFNVSVGGDHSLEIQAHWDRRQYEDSAKQED